MLSIGVRRDGQGGKGNEGLQLLGAGHDAAREEKDDGRRDGDQVQSSVSRKPANPNKDIWNIHSVGQAEEGCSPNRS